MKEDKGKKKKKKALDGFDRYSNLFCIGTRQLSFSPPVLFGGVFDLILK
jgi:hypothetical protein